MISGFPVAKEDVALIVDDDVPAAAVERALRTGAGSLLESIWLFDVYTGPQVGEGKKSLAYALPVPGSGSHHSLMPRPPRRGTLPSPSPPSVQAPSRTL